MFLSDINIDFKHLGIPPPDGSVWGSSLGYPGTVSRIEPELNPSQTVVVEYYELPSKDSSEPVEGFSIDDPNAGWKGRGLWATISTRAPFHMEGGKGTTSKVFKFQLRPDPLAK